MIHIFLIMILFLLIGFLGLQGALLVAQYFSKRAISIKVLFHGLRPKLWMTGGIGFFFFSLYGIIVIVAATLLNDEMRQYLFSLALQHPTYFIYAGLTIFLSISIAILAVRSMIKRVYNSRK